MTEEKGRTKAARTNITPKHSNKMLVCLEHLYQRGSASRSTRFMRHWLDGVDGGVV